MPSKDALELANKITHICATDNRWHNSVQNHVASLVESFAFQLRPFTEFPPEGTLLGESDNVLILAGEWFVGYYQYPKEGYNPPILGGWHWADGSEFYLEDYSGWIPFPPKPSI